jgi:peptidyl-prolyl cis-trans isomerase D
MLQNIRDRAQGWIAWAIVILISIPFALWGIQSYLGIGGEPVAATVNGVEIAQRELDRRVQQARMELGERLGSAYDPAQFDDAQLRKDVLDDMIREVLLVDTSNRLGMRVSDQEMRLQILTEPAFQTDGRFDKAMYERTLQLQGMAPAQFESQMRQRMVGTQLVRAVVASELVTAAELDAYQRLNRQKREVSYLNLPTQRFESDEPVSDEEIRGYYDANLAQFQVPEQVMLDYLVLDVEGLAGQVELDDAELQRVYDADQSRFGQPERREVRHILLTVPPNADQQAADEVLARIQAIRERIQGGESFEVVAKEVSEDPGSAGQGGSLGTIEAGIMDPAFDQAAFSLAANEISEPVRSRFGYHLIEVVDVQPAQIKPFAEVRDELREEVARQRAEARFYDLGERLANVVYESPDSLVPAAEELGLEIQHSDWIGRDGGDEGVLAQPKVAAAAFSEDVLVERRNSDLIEPERDVLQAVVIRVADHRDASTKPLDEVRDQVIAALRTEKARKAAADAAEAGAEALKNGADWATVAGEQGTVEEAGLVGRTDAKVPAAVRSLAFTLPVPAEGTASIGVATLDDGGAAIVRVSKVEEGEVTPASEGAPAPEASMLSQMMGRQAYEAMLTDMQRRAKVERASVEAADEG